jgi:hypothetical protein
MIIWSAIAAALAVAAPPTTAPPAATIPPQPALTDVIVARDAELFELYFLGCDPARLRTMIAPDVEFYHDKDGFLYRGADALIAKECAGRKAPDAWRARRELVRASLRVDPVPRYGAIEDGEHYFFERKGDGPEKRVGYGRFSIVWVLSPDGWRMSRALSFAHRAAD